MRIPPSIETRLLAVHSYPLIQRARLHVAPAWLGELVGWVFGQVSGFTIGRRVFLFSKSKRSLLYVLPPLWRGWEGLAVLLAHELVHVRQYAEQGIVGFLVRYLWNYLILRLRGHSHRAAYHLLPQEREAYAVERKFREIHQCQEI